MRPPFFRPRIAAVSDAAPGDPWPSPAHGQEFRAAVLPHLDGAYTLACYLTRDPVLSEDVVQDAFVRAFRAFPGYRGEGARAWLFAIVRNCCRSAMSAGQAGLQLVNESSLSARDAADVSARASADGTPEELLIRRREIDELRSAVLGLPEPFRETLVLRDMHELSYKEIALMTGVAIGTVMSRLARGRSMLADLMLPASDSASEPAKESK